MIETKAPIVNVGIMSDTSIAFKFNSKYDLPIEGVSFWDKQEVHLSKENKIIFHGYPYDELLFEPAFENASFELEGVTIGKNFHWQQKENQQFEGCLKLIVENGEITAINIIDVEKYLTSVISSEMKATSSIELLKAHSVISRSWLMAQITKKRKNDQNAFENNTTGEIIKWYDHDDHVNFDVCADDHCQRYQGITKQTTEAVEEAIQATRGQILMYGRDICDARFSKACGGVTETYENCWDNQPQPYLTKVVDNEQEFEDGTEELSQEDNAKAWILNGKSKSFCNTTSKRILSQVLNNYDQTTTDFYRWEQTYTQNEIKNIIETKSGYSFGDIIDLQPIERGASGRIIRLKIIGTEKTLIVGKELEIRKWLSPSHLYSSAFIVEKEIDNTSSIPSKFILKGAGWGHGVGLCQIGAAVMADKGFDYKSILSHYYKNAVLKCNYGD